MRATDDRYRGEQAKFDLAMRMIGHEARTGTIRFLTGLNDDRIRKLYTSYFKYGQEPVRRQRGRSPTASRRSCGRRYGLSSPACSRTCCSPTA
jgi:hypothetical protein